MSNIRDLIDKKHKEEDTLKSLLSDFLYKYINKIYKSLPDKRLKIFQKTLLYIPEWDESKQLKVYNKFTKYLKTKSFSNYDFEAMLENVISLNIKIILIFSDNYKNELVTIPEASEFLFRCIRYTAKAYYDCPIQIEDSISSQKVMIKEIVSWNIQKYIPLKKIFDYKSSDEFTVSEQEKQNESSSSSDYSGNEADDEVDINKPKSKNIEVEKQNDENEIKYLSENEINEYYKTQDETESDELNNVRHITLKKKSKKF